MNVRNMNGHSQEACVWVLGAGMHVTAGGPRRGTGKVGVGDRESAMFGM